MHTLENDTRHMKASATPAAITDNSLYGRTQSTDANINRCINIADKIANVLVGPSDVASFGVPCRAGLIGTLDGLENTTAILAKRLEEICDHIGGM